MTIIVAVEAGDSAVANGLVGSLTMPRVWARISDEVGTTTEAYVNFICHVMDTYDAVANPTLRQTIIHNNLSLHKLPEVYKAVDCGAIVWFAVHHTNLRMVLLSS